MVFGISVNPVSMASLGSPSGCKVTRNSRSRNANSKNAANNQSLTLSREEVSSLCAALDARGATFDDDTLICLENSDIVFPSCSSDSNIHSRDSETSSSGSASDMFFGDGSLEEEVDSRFDWLFGADRDMPLCWNSNNKRLLRKRKSVDQVEFCSNRVTPKRRSNSVHSFSPLSITQRSRSCPSLKLNTDDDIFQPFSPINNENANPNKKNVKEAQIFKLKSKTTSNLYPLSGNITPSTVPGSFKSISFKFNSSATESPIHSSKCAITTSCRRSSSDAKNVTNVMHSMTPQSKNAGNDVSSQNSSNDASASTSDTSNNISPFKVKPFEGDGSGWRSLREINMKINSLSPSGTTIKVHPITHSALESKAREGLAANKETVSGKQSENATDSNSAKNANTNTPATTNTKREIANNISPLTKPQAKSSLLTVTSQVNKETPKDKKHSKDTPSVVSKRSTIPVTNKSKRQDSNADKKQSKYPKTRTPKTPTMGYSKRTTRSASKR